MNSIKKIWSLLDLSQKKKSFYVLILMIISMFLEILGVGLAIPAITLLIKPNIPDQYPFLIPVINFLGNPSYKQLVIIGMMSLIFIYLVKNLFIGFFTWYQNNYTFKIKVILSQRLFEHYLKQPYMFHLRRNSAILIRNIQEAVSVTGSAIGNILILGLEFLVFIGIIFFLLYVEPLGAVIVGTVIGFIFWIIHIKSKNILQKWGAKQVYSDGQAKQHLMQGLGGVKEVKILGREKSFFSLYHFYQKTSANLQILFNFVNQLPRLLFEILALTGLVGLVIVMIMQDRTIEEIIPTLGLFAVAAFRLMPSTNKIISSAQSFHYAKAQIDIVWDEFNLLNKEFNNKEKEDLHKENISIPKNSIITLKNIFFTYPETKKVIIDNVSLKIKQGENVGFIGESGSGKTTLVDLILGLLQPDSGEILINEKNIYANLRSWQDQIGYVPQSIYLTDDTLRRNIALGLQDEHIDDKAIDKAILSSQLKEMVNNLPEGLNTKVGERGVRLSGGQKQRIGIARALYHDPEILVLDEATSSLDSETESGIVEALKEIKGKKTIIIIAHRLSTVKHCDRLIRVTKGKIHQEN